MAENDKGDVDRFKHRCDPLIPAGTTISQIILVFHLG